MKKLMMITTLSATLLIGGPVGLIYANKESDKKSIVQQVEEKKPVIKSAKIEQKVVKAAPAKKEKQATVNKSEKVVKMDTTNKATAKKVTEKKSTESVKKQITSQSSKPNSTVYKTIKPSVPVSNTKPVDKQPSISITISAIEKKVVDLTNAERTKAGLKPFTIDNQVSKVARIKSEDMTNKNYFDHNSPTYGSPFDMLKQFGISYRAAAENIAKGQKTPEEVVKAWMNSAGHRANIMNGNLTHIGVGYDSRTNSWTQMFISK